MSADGVSLASLATRSVWVGWKEEVRTDKSGKKRKTKIPFNPKSGRKASSTDASTWASRDEASKWVKTAHGDGVGLVLTQIDEVIVGGIDLDTCRDPNTGAIEPWAQAVIDHFDTYAEVSPSETGVKLFFVFALVDLPAIKTLLGNQGGRAFKRPNGTEHPPAIELYAERRYFTVTEKMVSGIDAFHSINIADLKWLIEDHGPKFAGPSASPGGKNNSSTQPTDKSRSAKAYRAGAALKADGAAYQEMRDGLLNHSDSEIVDWANEKGLPNGERELRKVYDKAWSPGTIVKVAGAEMRLVELVELNERFALLEARGKASVYVNRHDRMTIQENDLKWRLANELVLTGLKDEKPIYEGAFKFWNRHARRHVYRRIAFTGKDTSSDTLNLFKGLGVTPREGCCERVLAHIRKVICSDDDAANDAMLKLMAWQIQNIGKPSRVIVVMRTKLHQAGKGLLLNETLLKIYGEAGFVPNSTDQVLGRFNDTIVGRAYIFLDEAMFFGDRRAADAIKSLATTTLYGIETKGLPVIQCPVGLNFWMATNHDVAAYIEEHDARYWVLTPSEDRVGDTAYFNEVFEELENGGREAFAYHLLNIDVSDFVPLRDIPKNNDAKREMIKHTINPFDARKWLEECCVTSQIIGHSLLDTHGRRTGVWHAWAEGLEFAFSTLSNAYTNWQAGVRSPVRPEPTPIWAFGEVLTKAGFGEKRAATERRRILPDADKCLEELFKITMPTNMKTKTKT